MNQKDIKLNKIFAKYLVILAVLSPLNLLANDQCVTESDLFLELVASKWAIREAIENSPEEYDLEKWQYLLHMKSEPFEKADVSEINQKKISVLLFDNNFSDNPEIEVNIFEDYWLISCRREKDGDNSRPLHEIKVEFLLECWNTVGSRKEFQACLLPLISHS